MNKIASVFFIIVSCCWPRVAYAQCVTIEDCRATRVSAEATALQARIDYATVIAPSATPSPTPTLIPSPIPSATPLPTPSATSTIAPSATLTPEPSVTLAPTVEPTRSAISGRLSELGIGARGSAAIMAALLILAGLFWLALSRKMRV